jgi:hypothetical protein
MDQKPRTLSTDELKARLLDRIEEVVSRFCNPGKGSYRKGERYFMLNPGRHDTSVGSFYVTMSGPYVGNWRDFAMSGAEGRGDVIDLIGLSLSIRSHAEKFKVAREFLGLDTEDPAERRKREARAAARKAELAAEKARRAEAVKKTRKLATAVWLSGQAELTGTPVDFYLRGRGIDLARLQHKPGAIRFHPACRYYFAEDRTDPETGEVLTVTRWRPMPAMLTAFALGREIIDCHRTYLERVDGQWVKARLPDAKKVFGDYTGGSARLSGELGPRGGHLTLRQAALGARVFITEGIENALSLAMLRSLRGQPPAYIIAAGMIWNIGRVELPPEVTSVTLAADNDQGEQAKAALAEAVELHSARGREVRVWRSDVPGEDVNVALRRALAAEQRKGAA